MKANQSMDSRKTYIDVVRGVAIILVVLGHIGVPDMMNRYIYGFHVPLFFIISGYLYHPSTWKRRAKGYLIPYIIYAIVNLICTFGLDVLQRGMAEAIRLFGQHILWIVLSNDTFVPSPDCDALWFLPCLFLTAVVAGYVIEHKRGIWATAIGLVAFLIFWHWNIHLPWHVEILPITILVYIIGHWIAKYKLLDKKIWWALLCFVVGSIAIFLNTTHVDLNHMVYGRWDCMLLGCVGLSYSLLYFGKHIWKHSFLFEMYGKHSMFIMGMHIVFAKASLLVLSRLPWIKTYSWWMNALLTILMVTIAVILIQFIQKKFMKREYSHFFNK